MINLILVANRQLINAVKNGKWDDIKKAIKDKADPNHVCITDGKTALHIAAESGMPKLFCESLIHEFGANPHMRDASGKLYTEYLKEKPTEPQQVISPKDELVGIFLSNLINRTSKIYAWSGKIRSRQVEASIFRR